jgi:hypothetical protein
MALLTLTTCFALSERPAFGQSLQIMFTFNNGTGNSGSTDAVNAPVTTQPAVTGATPTIYIYGIVTDSGVADTNLGISSAFLSAESAIATSGAFSVGTDPTPAVGITANSTTAPFTASGATGNGTRTDLNSDGIMDVGSLGTSFHAAQPLQMNPAENAGTYALGGGTVTSNSMPFGASTTTGGWAFLLGTLTFTEGTTGPSFTGSTSTNPVPPAYTQATDNYTATGSETGAVTTAWTSAGGVTFTAPVVVGGNTSNLTLKPTSTASPNTTTAINFTPSTVGNGYLVGATVPTQTMTLTESGGSATTYSTSAAPTGFTVVDNGSPPNIGANGTDTFTVGVTTTNRGSFSGNYTVTNTGSSSAQTGNLTVSLNALVGNATIDNSGGAGTNNSGTFGGNVLNAAVPAVAASGNGNYAGLSSTVTAALGTQGANSAGIEGTTATILMGSNLSGGVNGTSTVNVGMTWRTRLLDEAPTNDSVNNTSPPVVIAGNTYPNGTNTHYSAPLAGLPLISDVVNLFGMGPGSTQTVSTTPAPTDPFAFQMTFNPATLKAEGATNADMATRGNLYLASLVGGVWENTIDANVAITTGPEAGDTQSKVVNGVTLQVGNTLVTDGYSFTRPITTTQTFAQWAAANSVTAANLGDFLGAWGVDPDLDGTYSAWAIVDHNSEFAVVPEPSTIVLAAFGMLGGIYALRRKNALVA